MISLESTGNWKKRHSQHNVEVPFVRATTSVMGMSPQKRRNGNAAADYLG
jgi:hypothetical protein